MLSASALALAAFIIPNEYYTPVAENDFTRGLRGKTEAYTKHYADERVYVQFDKPMYEPGENIWLAAYIQESQLLKKSEVSDIVHVELIDPKGTVTKKISLIAHEGKAAGDFFLDEEMPGGLYKIRAYTNWMKNKGEHNVFEKEFQVQDVVLPNLKMMLEFEKKGFGPGDEVVARLQLNTNENQPLSDYNIKYVCDLEGTKYLEKSDMTDAEGTKFIRFKLPEKLKSNDGLLNVMITYNGNTESVSRSIPILLNKVDIAFFPEGGDLVEGLESNVAFRATNEYGKPADIDGIVVTEKGSKVGSFSSFHQGMGAFKLTPQEGEKYFVKITRPTGIDKKYELPSALQDGHVLNVDAGREGEITAVINSSRTEEVSMVAQVRGKIYYTNAIKAVKGANKVTFPTEEFPAGIAQITLFDSKGVPLCERLAFVNRDRQLSITVESEKEKYLPREKVKLNITVKDDEGNPVPANLSMSVVNDQFISFANSKQGNILSYLLFQEDLKEKIEDPAFYFEKKEPKSEKALDYLLMTAGWRQFTWEKVMTPNLPSLPYRAEKAEVSGMIYNSYTSKGVPNATVKLPNGVIIKADNEGKFWLKGIDLYEPVTLTFSAPGFSKAQQLVSNYGQHITSYIYNIEEYKKRQEEYKKQQQAYAKKYNYKYAKNAVVREEAMDVPQMNVQFDNVVNGVCCGDNVQLVPANAMPAGAMNFAWNNNAPMAIGNANGAGHFMVNVAGANLGVKGIVAENERAAEKKVMMMKDTVADVRMNKFRNRDQQQVQANGLYYRARKFAAPVYDKQEKVEARTDFRNTIYWNPEIEIGASGKGSVEFYASDDITSFRATVEGVGDNGNVGRGEKNFFTQLPFAMSTKVPVEVATGDLVSIPLTLKNNTNGPLGGVLSISAPDALQEMAKTPEVQTIMPGKAKTIYLDYKVLDKIGTGEFTITFKSCGLGDAFTQKIKVAPKGFPMVASYSAQEKEKEFGFNISHLVSGSIKATVTAYPNVVSDLMKGVEGILREPGGCFEQTSMSSYPNAMVLDYLKATDSKDEKTLAHATGLLERGYKKLVTFETKEKGYEWFGSNPGHEALTAYGLMQFNDMKRVGGNVDADMLNRTAKWLMDRRNGAGGFKRDGKALDYFGRASEPVTNAYIVYALSEAGYTDIKKEFNAAYEAATKDGDAYVMALVANAAYNLKEVAKGDNLLNALVKKQTKDGSFEGANHSITYSQGQSLVIETSSLAILALLKSNGKNPEALMNGVKWLVASRNGYGAFGNTQGTILALKALTEFAKSSRKTNEDGEIIVYIDGKKAGTKAYKAGEKDAIVLDGLEGMITGEGRHDIKVKFAGAKTALPYSVAVSWSTTLPNSQTECVVDLKTKLLNTTANVGETVRLQATVSNKKNEGIPSTMVIVGIPAGFTVQPWQLKELQDKKIFDYYEIIGNNIAIYYRCMKPADVRQINLDLKAEVPGEFDAPASSAYLYYTNELKTWSGLEKVTVKKGNG